MGRTRNNLCERNNEYIPVQMNQMTEEINYIKKIERKKRQSMITKLNVEL